MDNTINNSFLATIYGKSGKTATVYKNGKIFAQYSKAIAIDVAKDIHGDAVDDDTGEIIFMS